MGVRKRSDVEERPWGRPAIGTTIPRKPGPRVARDADDHVQRRRAALASAERLDEAGIVPKPPERLMLIDDAARVGDGHAMAERPVVTWYVVQTVPGLERQARDELLKIGHLARVPMRAWLKGSRRKDHRSRPVKVRAEAPLCGGYAFLGVREAVPDWRSIRGCDGVVSILGAGNAPEPIMRPFALLALFTADETGAFDATLVRPTRRTGPELLRVVEGPYAGFIARVVSAKGDAARVVISGLFGRRMALVHKRDLQPI